MAPHVWSYLGDTVSDDKYRMYYRGQRIKKAYYRGECIWDESSDDKDATEVRWWDADGTLLCQMAAVDFLKLKDWPKNIHPSKDTDEDKEWGLHAYLLDDGWTYTFEEAQAFVRKYRYLDIGALYKTEGNFTVLRIDIPWDNFEFHIGASNSYNVAEDDLIDWGDGSEPENVVLSQSVRTYSSHVYSYAGHYIIKIKAGHRWGFPSYENAGYGYKYYASWMIGGHSGYAEIQPTARSVFFGDGDSCSTAFLFNCLNIEAVFFGNGSDPTGLLTQFAYVGLIHVPIKCLIFPKTMTTANISGSVSSYTNVSKPYATNNDVYINSDVLKAVCFPSSWEGPHGQFVSPGWNYEKNESALSRLILSETTNRPGTFANWNARVPAYLIETKELVAPFAPDNIPISAASFPVPAGFADTKVTYGTPVYHPEFEPFLHFYVPQGTVDAWKTKLGATHPWYEYVTEIMPP